MKAILFNGQSKPQPGEVYVVTEVYSHMDGMYGPETAVVLEKVPQNKEMREYARNHLQDHLYDILVDWLKS